jgi:hypothetical protein
MSIPYINTLAEKRRSFHRSLRENRFHFKDILVGTYPDPAHFIFEILQNAEDAGATQIRFTLDRHELIVEHDGRPFTERDVEAITGIGITEKRTDLNQIGQFGIGFKSVFAVTDAPRIYSEPFSFEIRDFIIPVPIEPEPSEPGTRFRLPFVHNLRSQSDIYSHVDTTLTGLDPSVLVFLTSLQRIHWQTPDDSGFLHKESHSRSTQPAVQDITIDTSEGSHCFLRLDHSLPERAPLTVAMAFSLDAQKQPAIYPRARLCVFFPTTIQTKTGFLLHAPFRTTPNRETVPFDHPDNQRLLDHLATLVSNSPETLKSLNLLTPRTLTLFPLNTPDDAETALYSSMFRALRQSLSASQPLLPAAGGTFATADEGRLPATLKIRNCFDDVFLRDHGLGTWLETGPPQLIQYYKHVLGIQQLNLSRIGRAVTDAFLQRQTDEWLKTCYGILVNDPSCWTKHQLKHPWRRLACFRRIDGLMTPATDPQGTPQVWLPSDMPAPDAPVIKPVFVKDEACRRLFKRMNVQVWDPVEQAIKTILPAYQQPKSFNPDRYLRDIRALVSAWSTATAEQQKKLLAALSRHRIIYALNLKKTRKGFFRPAETYWPTESLCLYFEGVSDAYFVWQGLLDTLPDNVTLFHRLGVSRLPRRLETTAQLSHEEKYHLRGQRQAIQRDLYVRDYEWHGLEQALKAITPEKSALIWSLLLSLVEIDAQPPRHHLFEGEYAWLAGSKQVSRYTARFVRRLQEKRWLFDHTGQRRQPGELTLSQLSDRYTTEHEGVDSLAHLLGMTASKDSLDAVSLRKLELVRNIPEAELRRWVDAWTRKRSP